MKQALVARLLQKKLNIPKSIVLGAEQQEGISSSICTENDLYYQESGKT